MLLQTVPRIMIKAMESSSRKSSYTLVDYQAFARRRNKHKGYRNKHNVSILYSVN